VVGTSAEDGNWLAGPQPWMRAENPTELAVLLPPDRELGFRPSDPLATVRLDACDQVSEDLTAANIHSMVEVTLIEAEITPVARDWFADPKTLSLLVQLDCSGTDYSYNIWFVHITPVVDDGAMYAASAAGGTLGTKLDSTVGDVLDGLRRSLESVISDYRRANSI